MDFPYILRAFIEVGCWKLVLLLSNPWGPGQASLASVLRVISPKKVTGNLGAIGP
jgi:hypothetical protein